MAAAVRTKKAIVKALKKKGFEANPSKDHVVLIYLHDGKRTGVSTKVSHGSDKDVREPLIAKMAKQCRLTKAEFLDLVDCDLEEPDYRKKLQVGKYIAVTP